MAWMIWVLKVLSTWVNLSRFRKRKRAPLSAGFNPWHQPVCFDQEGFFGGCFWGVRGWPDTSKRRGKRWEEFLGGLGEKELRIKTCCSYYSFWEQAGMKEQRFPRDCRKCKGTDMYIHTVLILSDPVWFCGGVFHKTIQDISRYYIPWKSSWHHWTMSDAPHNNTLTLERLLKGFFISPGESGLKMEVAWRLHTLFFCPWKSRPWDDRDDRCWSPDTICYIILSSCQPPLLNRRTHAAHGPMF